MRQPGSWEPSEGSLRRRVRMTCAYDLCAQPVRMTCAHKQCAQTVRTADAHHPCAHSVRATNAHKTPPTRSQGWFWRSYAEVVSELLRRPLNLRVSADILGAAREARVNISALLEQALIGELTRLRRGRWREENARGVSAYNEHLASHGTCFEGQWDE